MQQDGSTVRFVDDEGHEWLVHQVVRQTGSDARSAYLPDAWQDGWLLFEHGEEKRRLAPVPRGWSSLDAAGLGDLLGRAIIARPSRWATRPPRPARSPREIADAIEAQQRVVPPPVPAPAPVPIRASAAVPASRRWTVLLIDETEADRALLRGALEALPITVVEASEGMDGLALALDVDPDLVLLDYRLPDMTGGAVLDRLRGDPDTAHVPVLWFTAQGRALNLDPRTRRASGRIEKHPFDADDARRVVLAALGVTAARS